MNDGFSVWQGFRHALVRELQLAFHSRAEVALAIIFFVITVSLFPLGIGARRDLLLAAAPGIVWVSALLATLLSFPRLFNSDFQDLSLEQWLLSPYPILALIGGKLAAHWLTTGVPLIILSPLLGLQFGLNADDLLVLSVSLTLGTPILSMLGAIGSALTLGARAAPALLALLVLPLNVPVLIFGAGALEANMSGLSPSGHLSLLGGGLLLAMLTTPWAIRAALRIAVE